MLEGMPEEVMENESGLLGDGGVAGHQGLHDDPADEVGYGAQAEDNHVARGLALETGESECRARFLGVGEQHAGTLVDEERAYAARHAAYARDGGYNRLGEHVTYGGEDVGGPTLVGCPQDAYQDDRQPRRDAAQGLGEDAQQGEESEYQHGAHAAGVGIHAQLVDEIGGQVAAGHGEHRDEIEHEDEQHAHGGV